MRSMSGKVIVSRSTAKRDRTRYYVVRVDGEAVGRLRSGGRLEVEVGAGTHELAITLDDSARRTLDFDLADAQTRHFCVDAGDLSKLGASWIEVIEL